MRALAFALLAGCFSPGPHAGYACNSDHWCPDPLVCLSDGVCHAPGDSVGSNPDAPYNTADLNIVFVTSAPTADQVGNYNLAEDFDMICQGAAQGHLPANHYKAWLSTAVGGDAYTRLGSARGFIRVDGSPFADYVGDIIAGRILNPINITELGGSPSAPDVEVLTQTAPDGTLSFLDGSGDCINVGAAMATIGQSDSTITEWTAHKATACTDHLSLYCFGTDYTTALPMLPASPGGYVFLSTAVKAGDVGFTALNNECTLEAQGHLPGSYRALIATGGLAPNSGLASPKGWYRPDGVLAIDAQFNVVSPIDEDVTGAYSDQHAWTGGGDTLKIASGMNCGGGWNASAATGTIGHTTHSGAEAVNDQNVACTETHHVYCIQQSGLPQ